MNVNDTLGNNQPNFQARLYLKNINKDEKMYFKNIAKIFHRETKSLKGTSFTLEQIPDAFQLTSNANKGNTARIEMNGQQGLLNIIISLAHLFRITETRGPRLAENGLGIASYSFELKSPEKLNQAVIDMKDYLSKK